MSKVSFRARALDVTKPMPVYRASEIPDLPDFATINRSVPLMPTGMEKEEESEHHLQRALSAQQVYGTSETLVIPIPEIITDLDHFNKLYADEYKQPKQYVHMQAFGVDQEIPDYDMDSDDEVWIKEQGRKMDITATKFEEMMDRLEKGSGQQVVTLHEAKALLKEDDDLIIAVYDYWLNKRLTTKHPLILQVKSEKRDGSTTNNPYVAFRRRSEKMQTRKNRKNDEVSYERMLKLRRDINRALTVLEMMKRREKAKKEMLQLTIEILEKRNSMGDYSGDYLSAAEKERLSKPRVPVLPLSAHWARPSDSISGKKKREYKKRRVKPTNEVKKTIHVTPSPQYSAIDVIHPDLYTSDDDAFSLEAQSPSDHEDENDPDGAFAFRRRKSCYYHAPLLDRLGHFSWDAPREGGTGDARHRYSILTLPPPYRCVGFGRRRVGRGGRILVDRAETAWDDALCTLDLLNDSSAKATSSDYVVYIRDRKINHFRPRTPPVDPSIDRTVFQSSSSQSLATQSSSQSSQFYLDSFRSHREELIRLRQRHQQLLTRPNSDDLSRPVTSWSLDTVAVRRAVSAVVDTAQLHRSLELAKRSLAATATKVLVSPWVTGTTTTTCGPTVTLLNGPSLTDRSATSVLASSPATVLQLNFPLQPSPSPDLRFQKPTKTILTHTNSLLKLTPANGTNSPLIRSNHEEPQPLRGLVNDTPIPMDVT